MSDGKVTSKTVGLGFLVVILAGLSTALGAAMVFFPRLVQLTSRRILASGLGFSAGVMIYLSFVESFTRSFDSFENHYQDDHKRSAMSKFYATISFFSGVALNGIIEFLVRKLSQEQNSPDGVIDQTNDHDDNDNLNEEELMVPQHIGIGCSMDPNGDLHDWQQQAQRELDSNTRGVTTLTPDEDNVDKLSDSIAEVEAQSPIVAIIEGATKDGELSIENEDVHDDHRKKRLVRMTFQTTVAIALHNFPEGLATFIAFLDKPSIGIAFAIAIAIHNIPEGLCVSLPFYYAPGKRTMAFFWGCFSGLTEPIGAVVGWLFLYKGMSSLANGILFGIVGGMMVMISLRELLPTAFRYDPKDTVVTKSLILGMFVMAISLVLFLVT